MLALTISIFVVLVVLGGPIFTALGVAGLVSNNVFMGINPTFLVAGMFSAVNSWVLLAAPFFLLTGNIMGECGPAGALFKLCDKFLGSRRGGLPCAVVLACVLFGAITGSGVATAVAIGSIALPEMLKRGYNKSYCCGLVGMSGTLGLMIPPSIYMIIFASLISADVLQFFTAGWLPGLFLAALLMIWAVLRSPKDIVSQKASWAERWQAVKEAFPALTVPAVILISIYSGVFTPTESAGLSVVYSVIVCLVAYRKQFNFQAFMRAARAAVKTTGQIYIILATVTGFTTILTYANIPQTISNWAVSNEALSPTLMLLLICVVYFLFGMFLDPVPILYLTIPIFYPALIAIGGNPIHFCVMTVVMMMIAQCTPPFGVILFAQAGQFKMPVVDVVKGVMPFLVVVLVGAVVLLVCPSISTWLPEFTGVSAFVSTP